MLDQMRVQFYMGHRFLRPWVSTCICLWAVWIGLGCSARPAQAGQHPHTFQQGDLHLNYLLSVPEGYGKGLPKRWPLLIFLHGSGERGSTLEDLERIKRHGPPQVLAQRSDLDVLAERFIVLSPQCPDWYWETQFDALDALLEHIQETYAIDAQRIYLTGISMGGFGTWQYALKHPHRFAAVVPIAGGYRYRLDTLYIGSGQSEIMLTIDSSAPEDLCDLKNVPVWVLHGELDTTIPHEQTADVMVSAFQACGGEVRYTLYPDAGHDAWTEPYNDPALYTWLLEQKRSGK